MESSTCGLSSQAAPAEDGGSQSATDWRGSWALWTTGPGPNKPGSQQAVQLTVETWDDLMSGLWSRNTSSGRCWSTTPSSTSGSGCWSLTGTLWLSGCTNLPISGTPAGTHYSEGDLSLFLDSVLSLIKLRISTSPSTSVITQYNRNIRMEREVPTCQRRTCGTTTPSSTIWDRWERER